MNMLISADELAPNGAQLPRDVAAHAVTAYGGPIIAIRPGLPCTVAT